MRTLCVIHDQGNYVYTWLLEIERDKDPVEAMREKLFLEDDDDWKEHEPELEWFFIKARAAEILRSLAWPSPRTEVERRQQERDMGVVYRAFGIEEITVEDALQRVAATDKRYEAILEALEKDWVPDSVGEQLDKHTDFVDHDDLVERYYEEGIIEDTAEGVRILLGLYRFDAERFLDELNAPPEPGDMSDEELAKEAEEIISSTLPDHGTIIRLIALEVELQRRGYSIAHTPKDSDPDE